MFGCRRLDEDLNFFCVGLKMFLKNVQKLSLLTDRRLYFCVEMQNWFVFSIISVDVHIPANVFATIMWSKNAFVIQMYFFNVYFITFKNACFVLYNK